MCFSTVSGLNHMCGAGLQRRTKHVATARHFCGSGAPRKRVEKLLWSCVRTTKTQKKIDRVCGVLVRFFLTLLLRSTKGCPMLSRHIARFVDRIREMEGHCPPVALLEALGPVHQTRDVARAR